MAYARVQPPLVLSLLPASECGAYRSWFNPFKQREINVSVDTFCKIERFRHRRHICFYVRKKKKERSASSLISTSSLLLIPFLFSLIHSLARRMLCTVRDIVRLLYRGNDSKGVKKDIRRIEVREGTRFLRPGWSIVHVFAPFSFPLGAILVDGSLWYFREMGRAW